MKKSVLFVLTIFVLLFGCKNDKATINKVWFFNEANFPDDDDDLPLDDPKATHFVLSAESFLDLQQDETYTSYFGKFDQGKWTLKDKKLILFNQKGELQFEIRSVKDDELKLYYAPRNTEYLFGGFENEFASKEDNPFSAENNKWRNKAQKKESDEEIAARLRNHFRFQEKYFAWGSASDIKVLDVNTTPSPLKIYSNGFELIHHTQQRPEWKNIFYDSTDCRKAFEKIYYIFEYDELDWIKTKDRFKMFASAFRQLQQKTAHPNLPQGRTSQPH